MKKLNFYAACIFFLVTISSISSCKEDAALQGENKILLLKIDKTSRMFEGGKELIFPSMNDFTLRTEYVNRGDFQYIQFYYQELDELIFDASTVFSGTGSISFPDPLDPPESFLLNTTSTLPAPNSIMESIRFNGEIEDFGGDLTNLWESVKHLQLVNEYLESNPNGKAYFYPYFAGTPDREETHKLILIFKN